MQNGIVIKGIEYELVLDKEAAIKKHCDKIYDELSELYKIINL